MSFLLDRGTEIVSEVTMTKPIENGIKILKRDIDKTCLNNNSRGKIQLIFDEKFPEEEYKIDIFDNVINIYAGEDLGFVYALLRISKDFLGIEPFWFWMDLLTKKRNEILIDKLSLRNPNYVVKYRGWFFNDEVLFLGWKLNEEDRLGWKMAFEALLRCGGNMAIPGTDRMATENRQLASDYGLWITHHHAEPLGAEMFARAYPDLEADYFKYPDKFQKLWEDAVVAQKDYKVVYNLCFRGQGDYPFWENDKTGAYDTDEKRGKAITEIIKVQADIVKKYVQNPLFCTNLYGEILELYEMGYIQFPEDVIFVKADNGFGKMVTRRRGLHNPRVNAMPNPKETRPQGIYYHVSFYDLQAANQLTSFPNTVDFVNSELDAVLKNKGNEFWVINCSNVKPHTYMLDAVAKKWLGLEVSDESQSKEFACTYFKNRVDIAGAFRDYPKLTVAFGDYEDEHAGEQFYTETVRIITRHILLSDKNPIERLFWFTGDVPQEQQIMKFKKACLSKIDLLETYLDKYKTFDDTTIYLNARLHYLGSKGLIRFAEAYELYKLESYEKAFVAFGDSAYYFEEADRILRASERDVWISFYSNEAQADYKFSAYIIKKAMGHMRTLGDSDWYHIWQQKYSYSKEDRGVHLILLNENHKTDDELYLDMKKEID